MDAAEYKPVVLGLIFLKYISDTFDKHHAKLVAEWSEPRCGVHRREIQLGGVLSDNHAGMLRSAPHHGSLMRDMRDAAPATPDNLEVFKKYRFI